MGLKNRNVVFSLSGPLKGVNCRHAFADHLSALLPMHPLVSPSSISRQGNCRGGPLRPPAGRGRFPRPALSSCEPPGNRHRDGMDRVPYMRAEPSGLPGAHGYSPGRFERKSPSCSSNPAHEPDLAATKPSAGDVISSRPLSQEGPFSWSAVLRAVAAATMTGLTNRVRPRHLLAGLFLCSAKASAIFTAREDVSA